MRLINTKTLRLETFVGENIPPYAILSHTWGADEEEVSFEDIRSGNIEKPGNGTKKLKGCCNQAKEDDLEYAWIDTCCIDKKSSKELDEAINSMFQWYKKASICYTYLSDVPHGDDSWDRGSKFFSSRWFQRGWTLQELLAPGELRFYNREWTPIRTKADMSREIEEITGISRSFLRCWEDFRQASVAQRMSWAAKRKTTRKEDTAYCLLGIFDVTMPMIYGEGDQALNRLQKEIMNKTGDHSILAWGLDAAEYTPSKSANVLSTGILATAPSDFANCRRIVLRKQDATHVNTFDISGGRLRIHLPLYTTSAGETYGLLNCGPENKPEQVVGIPIHKAVSGAAPDEYLRPQGCYSLLLPRTVPGISTKHIHIQMERQCWAHEAMGRRLWLHIDVHQKIKMKLEKRKEYPKVHWEKGRALIAEASDSGGHITRRYLAQFRTHGEGSRNVIVVLAFEFHGLQPRARCHLMTMSRDTALEGLSQNLIYMRPEALGKQAAGIGNLHVEVTVEEEQVAQEPMLVVKLAPASSSLEIPVDANLELDQVNLKLEFVRILQEEDQARLETKRLAQQKDEEMAALDQMKERLAVIEEHLRKLGEEKRALSDGVERGAEQVNQLTKRLNKARQQQDERSGRESEIQRRLDELETKRGPGNWFETHIKTLLNAGKIDDGLKDVGDSDSVRPQLSKAGESRHNIGGQTPLWWAATNGHKAIAKVLLEKGADIETKNKDGYTPLLEATLQGHEAVVRLLLEKGANIEANNNNDNMPLLLAAFKGHEAVVRLLLEKGANIEANNNNDNTPLSLAALNGHKAVARLLLEKGADIEAKNKNGYTPLLEAALNGHEAVVTLLLEKGANIEANNNNDNTPLSLAALNGHEAVARLLLEKGANIEANNNNDNTPLSLAAFSGHEAVARLLLEKGANIEAKSKDGYMLLSLAAFNGHEAVVRLLLEKGADIEANNNNDNTPLLLAALNGHEAVARLLLEKGADIEAKNKNGYTPLLEAALNGHEAVVRLLLEKEANIERKDNYGRTPLSLAVFSGHEAVVRLLLEKEANIEARSKDGYMPLLLAASNGHEAVVTLLLEKGANIEAKNNNDNTPLLLAALNGHKAVVRLLLEKGANIEAKSKDGYMLLSLAAFNGHEAAVRLLLEKEANIERKDNYGRTPLSLAAFSGHEAVVRLLLEKGANIEAKGNDGRTPLSLAALNGHEAVARLLREKRR